MITLHRCLELLDRAGIWYSHTSHPLAFTAMEVAAAESLSPHRLAKTVVYAGSQGYGLAVLPADCLVAMELLAGFMKDRSVRLATEREVGQLFPECDLGAMPPFGNLFGMPVIVDSSVANQEFIAFNAGTHRDVIHMSYNDFADLVQPSVAKFSFTAAEQTTA